MASVNSVIYVLVFCLVDLSIVESEVFISPTINVLGLMCNLNSVMLLLHMWVFVYLGHRCSGLRLHVD